MPTNAIVDPRPSDYRDGRLCVAYLAPDVMEAAGVSVDSVVRVTTHRGRAVLARVSAPPDGIDVGAIRFDRFIRQSLKAYPNEQVQVETVVLGAALQVVLLPGVDLSMAGTTGLTHELKKRLVAGRTPLCEGMLLYLKPNDTMGGLTYEVHSVTGGEGIVADATELYLDLGEDHEHGGALHHHHDPGPKAEAVTDTTYEDVGGLDEQIHGAPGTGKTLLARSVANEVNAGFFYVNGPEIVGTYSGQTEENLRKTFGDAAYKPPSIIFIDELDALAPVRGSTSTLSDSRAVTQLLALMDGLRRADGVMVIGTTNRIETVDPALRRAGRFDREIHFPTPSAAAREEILRVHTREMPLNADAVAAIPDAARRAYGFVGADLMELAREAGLNALRRAAQRFLLMPSLASYPASEDLVVAGEDFDLALKKVRPASLRESLMSYPTVGWEDIGGLSHVKRRLQDLIEKPLLHPELFARLGLSTNQGVLLYGPSGTGKTLLAQAIAHECGVNFISIQGPELFSQWFGESEESVRHVFNVARRAAPCVVFFDQLDSIAPRRTEGDHEGTRAPQRVVNQLLSELDGMERLGQVIVIGATNKPGSVDSSMLRPGRFGVHLAVNLPDAADRGEILRIHLRGAALESGVELDGLIDHLVQATGGLSGADIAFLCQSAKLRALEEAGFEFDAGLAARHFDEALPEVRVTTHDAPITA
ncbi:MAG: family ATPase, subfamily [Chloroflexi bacterium]|nr:family ATPase, subfamily [Chloroflexota bacterium]